MATQSSLAQSQFHFCHVFDLYRSEYLSDLSRETSLILRHLLEPDSERERHHEPEGVPVVAARHSYRRL